MIGRRFCRRKERRKTLGGEKRSRRAGDVVISAGSVDKGVDIIEGKG